MARISEVQSSSDHLRRTFKSIVYCKVAYYKLLFHQCCFSLFIGQKKTIYLVIQENDV